ncbi:Oligopeptide transporter 5 [Vanrija pseudolonga]|uniref:Oligopeptide transporter 5 n=1 Tax=Vanrija pseudolonga TaxID=143232 RepID=A0AAF0Y987_9TREE|nr:Oligopeptide transporter 5 [Vanrija pseudolonga]
MSELHHRHFAHPEPAVEERGAAPFPEVPETDVTHEKDVVVSEKPKGSEYVDASVLDPNADSSREASNEKLAHEPVETEHIIKTGADAANYLLSIRDDHDQALTVRSMVLGTAVAAFQATMNQIYLFKPTNVTISGTFIVLIIWFLGRLWAFALPRGDRLLAKRGPDAPRPWWVSALVLLNPGPFTLKEHAVAAITASSASNGAASISVFTVQKLFYNTGLNAATVILSTLSIGLFGYGLTGILRPMTVWHVESVYWTNIPLVKILQALHWDDLHDSKPLRWFWYCFSGMTVYEFLPAYIMPWLNSVSVPCLAAMHTKGSRGAILNNIFGGSLNNQGLGILNYSFDWQYLTSTAASMPLKLQANFAAGIVICYIAMIAVYYGNAWGAKAQPFMSTSLRTAAGGRYNSSAVFINGILDEAKLESVGLPQLAGTYTWALMIGNAAIGALIGHIILFWGKDIVETVKKLRKNEIDDRHHRIMMENYKEAPWWWYITILIGAFVLGIIVVTVEHLTLPVWGYIVALLLGAFISPFSTILYARFGNGIATNALMKMVAGVAHPGRPIANLYFSAWSHSVISQSLNLASDLKMGEYLKIPPRVMFLTQVWGTIFGAFINYVVMISVVNQHRNLLVNSDGNSAWSGQYFQSLDNQATTWALAKYLYSAGKPYVLVPAGLGIGFGICVLHWVIVKIRPAIGRFDLRELNTPQLLVYSGYLGYNQTQTCIIWSTLTIGFFFQYYLRNYHPRFFKDYSYLVMAGFDGGSLLVLFILSFAVFGAGGPQKPFPNWWGNPADGYPDHCPST